MGNTVLAKLPSKVQVGLFLRVILWAMLPNVCSSEELYVLVDSCPKKRPATLLEGRQRP